MSTSQMHAIVALRYSAQGWVLATEQLDQSVRSLSDSTSQYLLLQQDVFGTGQQLRPELSRHFRIPQYLSSDVYRRSNGYFVFEESLDGDGNLESCHMWFRTLIKIISKDHNSSYKWHEMTFCCRWSPERCTILCSGVGPLFQSILYETSCRLWSEIPPLEPLSVIIQLIEAIVTMYDQSVWSMRDVIRNIEKNRLRASSGPPDFVLLHEVARHATHSSETLQVSIGTFSALQSVASERSHKMAHKHDGTRAAHRSIIAKIGSQIRMLQNLYERSQSNKERLQNEIALAFNIITQRDSQLMARLTEAGRQDSRAMRTIAIVTMAFLPPTFLSAIFSMSFFNYTPAHDGQAAKWSVSEKFWIYWVFAIPLTCLTLGIWFWQQRTTGSKSKVH